MTSARSNNSVLHLDLDRRSPIPVYIQISDAIRAKIQSGKLSPDSVLPPSEQICEKLGITRMTLRQAYNVLAAEGLVDAQRGRGTFIRRSKMERTLGQMVGFSEEMRAWGKKPSSKTLSFGCRASLAFWCSRRDQSHQIPQNSSQAPGPRRSSRALAPTQMWSL